MLLCLKRNRVGKWEECRKIMDKFLNKLWKKEMLKKIKIIAKNIIPHMMYATKEKNTKKGL